jgi:hypothetical protein
MAEVREKGNSGPAQRTAGTLWRALAGAGRIAPFPSPAEKG